MESKTFDVLVIVGVEHENFRSLDGPWFVFAVVLTPKYYGMDVAGCSVLRTENPCESMRCFNRC